jgi:hypothetical protein
VVRRGEWGEGVVGSRDDGQQGYEWRYNGIAHCVRYLPKLDVISSCKLEALVLV